TVRLIICGDISAIDGEYMAAQARGLTAGRVPGLAPTTLMPGLFDRNKDRMADLALDVLRQVALAGGVLDKDHLAAANHPALPIAGGDLHPGVEIDDILPPWRRVPIDVVFGLGLAEDDAIGRQASGKLAAAPFLDPFDFDVAKMRLAVGVGIEVVNAHKL